MFGGTAKQGTDSAPARVPTFLTVTCLTAKEAGAREVVVAAVDADNALDTSSRRKRGVPLVVVALDLTAMAFVVKVVYDKP